jgi:pimeloyl-ACP methyl ester carboxylesterase
VRCGRRATLNERGTGTTLNNAIEHRRVDANGITFHVASTRGSIGPPILCVHGFPEGWMSFRPVMERLAAREIHTPDLRGYPGSTAAEPYDVFTLTDDVKALIETLGLDRPVLVAHDWGGAIGWWFAHRYSPLIRRLVIINCTHPKTLIRAVLHVTDWQPFRIPWVPFFELPKIPEVSLSSSLGRKFLRFTFLAREGRRGTMDRALVEELVARFQTPADLHGPINYYREIVATVLRPSRRRRLYAVYDTPIAVPVTVVWGVKDRALPLEVAAGSALDAGCDVEWRLLPGVGHFVDLEAADELAAEVDRIATATAA